jgi:hypothetical protein
VKLSIPRFGFGFFAIRFENLQTRDRKKAPRKANAFKRDPCFSFQNISSLNVFFSHAPFSHASNSFSRAVDVFEEPYGVPQRLD